jgi:hypothetical protein
LMLIREAPSACKKIMIQCFKVRSDVTSHKTVASPSEWGRSTNL